MNFTSTKINSKKFFLPLLNETIHAYTLSTYYLSNDKQKSNHLKQI